MNPTLSFERLKNSSELPGRSVRPRWADFARGRRSFAKHSHKNNYQVSRP